MSTEPKPDTRFHDQHAAAIFRAIALRFYQRYVEMRHAAKLYGGDLNEPERLQDQAEAEDAYLAAVEACIWEGPDSAAAAMAMAKFAGILATDRLIGEILQTPVNDHRDAFHQSVALDALVQWVHSAAVWQAIEKDRASAQGGRS